MSYLGERLGEHAKHHTESARGWLDSWSEKISHQKNKACRQVVSPQAQLFSKLFNVAAIRGKSPRNFDCEG
jgi:hypothetical protein